MNRKDITLFFSGLGVILGFLAFVIFSFYYNNTIGGMWAFFSAVSASGCFHLALLDKRETLREYHDGNTLDKIIHFGFTISLISFAYMIWYIFNGIYYKQGIYPISDSSQICAVWSFMCGKWTTVLFYKCRCYKTEYHLYS